MAAVWSLWSSSERVGIAVAVVTVWGAVTVGPVRAQVDPTKVETAEACGECHASEHRVWKETEHARGFKTLHRTKAAEAIASSMGIRLLKRDSLCLNCHYTPTAVDGELRAVSGVSCESCHGAGQDWIDVHNDYGGKGVDHQSESAPHRAQRIERSRDAGMRRPSDDLYAVAASCFGCHTVPQERLVNVGGHGTGSAGFELAAWSQGINRHNFLDSLRDGDGTQNAEREPPHLRRLYVLGRALDVEYALRGMAAATESGVYAKAMSRRLRGAVGELRALTRRTDLAELQAMLEIVRSVEAIPGNGPALSAAADRIGAASRRFLTERAGDDLASVDPLRLGIEEPELAVADPPADVPAAVEGSESAVVSTTDRGVTDAPPTSTTGAPASNPTGAVGASAPATTRRAAVPAVGARKRRIRSPSEHGTVGPAECGSCHRHRDQNRWWLDDPHSLSADPFFEERRENVQIARFYGLSTGDMTKGNNVCMDCHGTVVSGRESRDVQDGVGCEGCHGAAASYLEPHQEGDPALGKERPGYKQALGLGMVELEDLEARAAVCTECHDIVDSRLLSSGHPSGRDFDYAGSMAKIRHWDHADPAAEQVRQVFAAAVSGRGPVPDVARARAAETVPAGAVSASAQNPGPAGSASSSAATAVDDRRTGARPRGRVLPPRARPVGRRAASTSPSSPSRLLLPSFPEIAPDASIETRLRILQRRLAFLYRTIESDPVPDEGDP